jgi:hypothetical protein
MSANGYTANVLRLRVAGAPFLLRAQLAAVLCNVSEKRLRAGLQRAAAASADDEEEEHVRAGRAPLSPESAPVLRPCCGADAKHAGCRRAERHRRVRPCWTSRLLNSAS